MQIPLSESSRQFILLLGLLSTFAIFCMFSGCVTANTREKRKYTKKNKFCCCRTKHTCNWMLMSTEYSLQSCKEISHCFAQYFSYLDNLFCVNECMCLYKWRCAFEQTETNFFFTYKFIFCTVFFASCNGIFCFVGSLKRKRTWRLPLYMWLFFFVFCCCLACSWYEQRTNCVRQCKVGCC